jgi:hypothetical protein
VVLSGDVVGLAWLGTKALLMAEGRRRIVIGVAVGVPWEVLAVLVVEVVVVEGVEVCSSARLCSLLALAACKIFSSIGTGFSPPLLLEAEGTVVLEWAWVVAALGAVVCAVILLLPLVLVIGTAEAAAGGVWVGVY